MPLAGEWQCMDWHIPLGGSTLLYAIELDLVKNSKWFKCCKN
jgi:hypothetical protein